MPEIPQNISRNDLLRAIKRIDEEGIPANAHSSIRVIQKLSGHKSLQSVQPYLDANEDMVKSAVELVA